VAHFIMKDPQLRDNPPNPDPAKTQFKPMGDYDTQLHLYDKGHPDVHLVLREFRAVLNSYEAVRPRYSVGEIHIFDWKEWASYYGKNLDELHMPFNFALLRAPWQAKALRGVVNGLEAALPPGAWPNYVLGNHDEPRLASRYSREQARVAAVLLLTLRGTPTLYQGDELGMVNGEIPFDQQQDPFGIRVPGLGRDVCRTPMQWSDSPNAGFAPPHVKKCWLPVTSDYHEVNVERELADPTSFLNLYRKLLAYRRATPALHSGSYRPIDNVPQDCYVYMRQSENQRVLVMLNFSNQDRRIALPTLGAGEIVISTGLDRSGLVKLADCTLRGNEGLIIKL
jgi:alpha-glucosidase